MAEGIHQDVPPKLYMAAIAVQKWLLSSVSHGKLISITSLVINTFAIYVIPIINCTNLVTTPLD